MCVGYNREPNGKVNYLFVGVLFSLVVDISTWLYRRQGLKVPPEAEWDNNTRMVAILIWPIGAIYFLAGVVVSVINKNNNNKNN